MLASGQAVRETNFADRLIIAVTSPLEHGMGGLVDAMRRGWGGYVGLRSTHAENQRLTQQNAELKRRVQELSEAGLENERLRTLLTYSEETIGHEVASRVIGVNPVSN